MNSITKVLLIRHEIHQNNVVSREARQRAFIFGQKLTEIGLIADVAMSSPQPRCLITLYSVLRGMNSLLPIRTDDAIGDGLLGKYAFTEAEVEIIKITAKTQGVEAERLLLTTDGYREKMILRGHEGAQCITGLVNFNPGKTIATCSHGGSRIETTICSLRSDDIADIKSDELVPMGGGTLLIFEGSTLKEVTYLGNLQ
jgi:hypothetical protein